MASQSLARALRSVSRRAQRLPAPWAHVRQPRQLRISPILTAARRATIFGIGFLNCIGLAAYAGSCDRRDGTGTQCLEIHTEPQITIIARDVSLGQILRAISRHIPLQVTAPATLDLPVTRVVRGTSWDLTLRRLLKHQNFALAYAEPLRQNPLGPEQLTRLWIYPHRSDVSSATPAVVAITEQGIDAPQRGPMSCDRTMTAFESALADENSNIREEAVVALGASDCEYANQLLLSALGDEDEVLRHTAIDTLVQRDPEEALSALGIALSDPAPLIRLAAVEALGDFDGRGAIELLQRAVAEDPEPLVRNIAAEQLRRFSS